MENLEENMKKLAASRSRTRVPVEHGS